MATARFSTAQDKVTLTLSTSEALYVVAELAGGNSWVHCVEHEDTGVYSALVAALDISPDEFSGRKDRHGLHKRYREHLDVAKATRPEYDIEGAKKVARKHGFLGEKD